MRKWISVACTVVLLLAVAACSSPFTLEPETEPVSAGRTYVITSQTHQGLDAMTDSISWQDNSLCVVEYLGGRSTYNNRLQSVYRSYFSAISESDFSAMQKVDLGGNDVYLVVPRFDLERISVFSIAVDSNGKSHILRQVTDSPEAFLLLCESTGKPNAQLSIALSESPEARRVRVTPKRDAQTGELKLASCAQGLEKL